MRLSSVSRNYGLVRAVWKADLEVYPGDFIAIFGPNGAGKTTLVRIIASLTSPSSGSVTFKGNSLARSQVGYASHQSLLYNEMTGEENLVFYARLYNIPRPHARAQEMLGKMGLLEAREQRVRGYSRGMKQRLTLARALLHEPGLLLLDEPYTGLDQHGTRLLTSVLKGLREEKRTVLLITHSLNEGIELCTRLLIQHRGEIVFQARREDVDLEKLEQLYFRLVERN